MKCREVHRLWVVRSRRAWRPSARSGEWCTHPQIYSLAPGPLRYLVLVPEKSHCRCEANAHGQLPPPAREQSLGVHTLIRIP
jgi:hypothetical protein